MKKNTLYILAAAALVGFYFWNKNKKATALAAFVPEVLTRETINILPSPPQYMPDMLPEKLPFTVTDAQVGPGQQISPTPSSVLDPAQLIKFNTMVKGSLTGVC
jgi:hypothetical protein